MENTSKLLALPKLRKLRFDEFEDVEVLLEDIVKARGQDIVGLTCNENFWLWVSHCRFQNVRKLTIINEGVVEGMWCAESFNDTLGDFPQLTELYLIDISVWAGDSFWEMIRSCPQLQLIYLQNHEITDGFLEFNASSMGKALCHRQEPLTIHFSSLENNHKNLYIPQIVQVLNHPKVKLSFEVIKDAYPILVGGLIELEFTPLMT
ncbi:uncharacterized protein LOC108107139 isoform X1 [Drosophila eugracilis]|uniref:uncharacterized protein LOC108107139 isoform X1 n=1 Tax=Drosophila eugracilis TaxID=29029 RepID=UPI001BDB1A07|nr:uncharacterized protein LOC108107139 isoform X1 [Drosophila eugracilis]